MLERTMFIGGLISITVYLYIQGLYSAFSCRHVYVYMYMYSLLP